MREENGTGDTSNDDIVGQATRFKQAGAVPADEVTAFCDEVIELAKYADRLHRILSRDPEVGAMRQDGPNGVAWSMGDHPMNALIFAGFADMLERTGAVDYVNVCGYTPKAGRIEFTVQRVGKLTPHTAREQAEQHLKRAVALLAENGIPWDGPTSFLPDAPIHDGISEPGRDWL